MAIQRTAVDRELERPRRLCQEKRKRLPSATCVKSLHFSELTTVIFVKQRSKEDFQNSWYSADEISMFKRMASASAYAVRDTRTTDKMRCLAASIEYHLPPPVLRIRRKELMRGLEHRSSPEVARHILRRRKRAIRGVVEAQNHLDRTSLAIAYKMNSRFANEWTRMITQLHDDC